MNTAIAIRPALPALVDWRFASQRPTGLQHHFKTNSEKASNGSSASISDDRQKKWHDLVVKSPTQQAWRGVYLDKVV